MNPATLTCEEQQRLLQRGIDNVLRLLNRAFASQLIADFEFAQKANAEFKAFVTERITAPEIRAYAAQLVDVRHGAADPGLVRIMFMSWGNLFSGQSVRAKKYTLNDAYTLRGQYGNLQLLVNMMEPEE